MSKKYTLDTPLDPEGMDGYAQDEPITRFGLLVPILNFDPFDYYFEGIRYNILCHEDETRVAVDMNNTLGKKGAYKFDTFEEAINAHIIVTDPDKVLGDLFMDYNDSYKEK